MDNKFDTMDSKYDSESFLYVFNMTVLLKSKIIVQQHKLAISAF